MLRRFVPFRRMLAVALAGVALGACSGATKDATAPSTLSQPDLTSSSSRAFTLTSRNVSFAYNEGGFSPTTQTVEASGLITLAMGYVLIGKPQYQPSNVKDWLTVRMRPRGKIIEITFTPRFAPGVDLGAYALVPITVPGASNNPQIVTVRVGDLLGCPISGTLAFPSLNPLVGELNAPPDCLYDFYGEEDEEDWTPFDSYALTVPANTQFTILMRGRPSDGGTSTDPYLYLWDFTNQEVVATNDDGGRGFNIPRWDSKIVYTNTDAAPKLFFVLASQCCGGNGPGYYGTYSIDIYAGDYTPPYNTSAASLSVSANVTEPILKTWEAARNYAQAKELRRQGQQH